MLGFKDYLRQDMDVFFNTGEFAVYAEINGIPVKVIKDEEKLEQLKSKDVTGLASGDILFYISDAEYEKIPRVKHPPQPGEALMYGSKPATVTRVVDNSGIYQIIIQFAGAAGWR